MFLLTLAYIFQRYTEIRLSILPNTNICNAYISIQAKPLFYSFWGNSEGYIHAEIWFQPTVIKHMLIKWLIKNKNALHMVYIVNCKTINSRYYYSRTHYRKPGYVWVNQVKFPGGNRITKCQNERLTIRSGPCPPKPPPPPLLNVHVKFCCPQSHCIPVANV